MAPLNRFVTERDAPLGPLFKKNPKGKRKAALDDQEIIVVDDDGDVTMDGREEKSPSVVDLTLEDEIMVPPSPEKLKPILEETRDVSEMSARGEILK